MKVPRVSLTNQPDEDEDGDDDEEEDEDEEDGLLVSPPPCCVNLTNDDDVTSLSFSFLLPVQTDLWAGLNCHVTFFAVDVCSTGVAAVVGVVVVGLVAMGTACVTDMLVVTPLTFLTLPLLFLSCSLKSSLSTSGSVVSSNMSQPSSSGSCLGRARPADLVPAAEILEERLGSESDRSESQSLSPATEPQPSTETSTGPDPELSESDSLGKHNRQKLNDCCAGTLISVFKQIRRCFGVIALLSKRLE